MQDAVRIDIESYFNLRHTAGRGWDAVEMKGPKILIVAGKRTLSLQHLDFHSRLIVTVSRKDLRFASGNGRVARNHCGRDATRGLNRQAERRYIEEEHVLDIA